MSFELEIRPIARIEILEAYDWYEAQRAGLGVEFLEALEQFYEILHVNPHTFSYYDEPVRDGKINRFPYTVAYEVVKNTIIIYSVFMVRQHPDKKRKK